MTAKQVLIAARHQIATRETWTQHIDMSGNKTNHYCFDAFVSIQVISKRFSSSELMARRLNAKAANVFHRATGRHDIEMFAICLTLDETLEAFERAIASA